MARGTSLLVAMLAIATLGLNPCNSRRARPPRYQFNPSPWLDYTAPFDTNEPADSRIPAMASYRPMVPFNLSSYFVGSIPQKRSVLPAYMISPVSNQLLEIANQLPGRLRPNERTPELQDPQKIGTCRAEQSDILLTRDETDLVNGRVIRTCRGIVRVNMCDGLCGSLVKPSINSDQGLKKDCYCCNEGAFRVTRVKLDECYSSIDPTRKIPSDLSNPASYMMVAIEEPIDCSCRQCFN